MTKAWMIAACALCLTGCYTVNDQRFASHVQTLVSVGMPKGDAIAALQHDGFTCDSMQPMPSKTCSNFRQQLLPSTCVERVNLYMSDRRPDIERVEVQKIMCAGF